MSDKETALKSKLEKIFNDIGALKKRMNEGPPEHYLQLNAMIKTLTTETYTIRIDIEKLANE